MDLQLLIDSIVRQTTVLIAQLATAGGVRAPLAQVADQVFLELADELHSQGVSRKVSADMFGLALRTYLRRIQRLRESSTDRGRSLWEAVLAHLEQGQLVTRAQVLQRFRHDDPVQVNGVLHDLCESGLCLRLGVGAGAAYRAATRDELGALEAAGASIGGDELLWALIYREGPLTRAELERRVRGAGLSPALERLSASGRIEREGAGQAALYSTNHFFVPAFASSGFEAAVFDHFQAMVTTITAKLRVEPDAAGRELTGGSTYSFEVWPGHPLRDEVLGQLAAMRAGLSELRARVRAHNAGSARPSDYEAVTIYGGQAVVSHCEEQGEGHV